MLLPPAPLRSRPTSRQKRGSVPEARLGDIFDVAAAARGLHTSRRLGSHHCVGCRRHLHVAAVALAWLHLDGCVEHLTSEVHDGQPRVLATAREPRRRIRPTNSQKEGPSAHLDVSGMLECLCTLHRHHGPRRTRTRLYCSINYITLAPRPPGTDHGHFTRRAAATTVHAPRGTPNCNTAGNTLRTYV